MSAADPVVAPSVADKDKQKEEAAAEHPLRHKWTLWHSAPSADWGKFDEVFTFETVEQFWGLFNNLKPPSQLEVKSNVMLFRQGVRPEWEDPFNAQGGMWRITYRRPAARNQFDVDFLKLVMMVVGEQFGPDSEDICGVMLSPRKHADRIELWVRNAGRKEALARIEATLVAAIEAGRGCSFSAHK